MPLPEPWEDAGAPSDVCTRRGADTLDRCLKMTSKLIK